MRGRFIVFEGIDKSGKSTQSRLLGENLPNSIRISFPDRSTTIGQMINGYLQSSSSINDMSIHLLFSANRWEHRDMIIQTLHKGTDIICDRYAYSGVAYTSAKGYNLEQCKAPDKGLPMPDFVFYLNAKPAAVADRSQYGQQRYQKKEFQQAVLESYQKLVVQRPEVIVLDGSLPAEVLASQILEAVNMGQVGPLQGLW